MNTWEESLLSLLMIFIMFGMGASLTFRDFGTALRHPHAVGIGFASQYLFMPFIAYMLAIGLGLNTPQTVSLVLMGCVPGGTTSNILTYFARGHLGLSIMMTICSTLAAVIMVPLILVFYTSGMGDEFVIPSREIVVILGVLLVPSLLGMATRKLNANTGATFELLGSLLGIFVILFLIGMWIPRNTETLGNTPWTVYAAVVGLGLCGFVIGYWFARATGLEPVKARTVSLETGIQNGPLAILIVAVSFTGDLQREMLLVPMLYSGFIVLTSTLVMFFYRARSLREELARDQAKVEPAK
ncbi:MAG: transporter [Halomonadaceae bacterium]|nr:MAG: transporter [Halomonadaceae bacterium]